MKNVVTVALLAVATMIMAGSALAQDHPVKANVPFSFTVSTGSLPAGTYLIDQDSRAPCVIHITNREAGVSVMALDLTQSDANKWEGSGALVFHQIGDKYYLSEVRYGGYLPTARLSPSRD